MTPKLRLLLLCAALLACIAYWAFGRPKALSADGVMAREYQLYKTESRPEAELNFEALSNVRDEDGLKSLLTGLKVHCRADWTGMPGATRSCAVDLKALNGVPTMYVNFTFDPRGLIRAASAVPQEAHEQGRSYIEQTFGKPVTEQARKSHGVRLAGWALSDDSTLFYNRDRYSEPYQPSSIQWLPKDGCSGKPCINPR